MVEAGDEELLDAGINDTDFNRDEPLLEDEIMLPALDATEAPLEDANTVVLGDALFACGFDRKSVSFSSVMAPVDLK